MFFVLLSYAKIGLGHILLNTPDLFVLSLASFKVIKKAKSIHWTLRILGDFKDAQSWGDEWSQGADGGFKHQLMEIPVAKLQPTRIGG